MDRQDPLGADGSSAVDVVRVPVRRRWLLIGVAVGALLGVLSVAQQTAKHHGWQNPSLQLDRLLNLDEDLSFMNWVSASMFLLGALGAWAVAAVDVPRRVGWWATAAVLAFVSVDEAVSVHDPLQVHIKAWLKGGPLTAVPVALAATAAGVLAVRFLWQLAPAVRWRLVGSLALIAIAAVGIDSLGPDLVNDPARRLEPSYVLKSTLEEELELGAGLIAVDAMLIAALRR